MGTVATIDSGARFASSDLKTDGYTINAEKAEQPSVPADGDPDTLADGHRSQKHPEEPVQNKEVEIKEDPKKGQGKQEPQNAVLDKPSSSLRYSELLQPPENYANVAGLIYRSSFPRPENFPFLRRLHLKSIVVLIPEPYPVENQEFLRENNIKFYQVPISGNKEPFINIPQEAITEILKIVLNPENQPLLIHCNRGKHRTGCLAGCIRKLQNWSLTMIFDEYRRFALPKVRSLDQQFIELYEDSEIINLAMKNKWLPMNW